MRLSRGGAAHLAGIAVAVENVSPRLFGYFTGESRLRLRVLKKIFAGLQFVAVIIGEDLVPLFIAEFPDPARPFGYASSHLPEFSGSHYPSDIFQKMGAQLIPRSIALHSLYHYAT